MQRACTLLQFAVCLVLSYFSLYLIHGTYFGRGLLNIIYMCWCSVQYTFVTVCILKTIQQDTVQTYIGLENNLSVIVVRFHWKLTYRYIYWENFQILNFIGSRLVYCGQNDGLTWNSKLWLLAISREHLNWCNKQRGRKKWPLVINVSYCLLADIR